MKKLDRSFCHTSLMQSPAFNKPPFSFKLISFRSNFLKLSLSYLRTFNCSNEITELLILFTRQLNFRSFVKSLNLFAQPWSLLMNVPCTFSFAGRRKVSPRVVTSWCMPLYLGGFIQVFFFCTCFFTYLVASKHSRQTRLHRGSEEFNLSFVRRGGICPNFTFL